MCQLVPKGGSYSDPEYMKKYRVVHNELQGNMRVRHSEHYMKNTNSMWPGNVYIEGVL